MRAGGREAWPVSRMAPAGRVVSVTEKAMVRAMCERLTASDAEQWLEMVFHFVASYASLSEPIERGPKSAWMLAGMLAQGRPHPRSGEVLDKRRLAPGHLRRVVGE